MLLSFLLSTASTHAAQRSAEAPAAKQPSVLAAELDPALASNRVERLSRADRSFLHLAAAEIIRVMELQPGATVLDIGAGLGFYTLPLAKAVGPHGVVFATEIDEELLERLTRRARRKGIGNVKSFVVQGTDFDEAYLDHSYDVVLLSSVFRYIHSPADFFRRLRPTLREHARVHIIESRCDPGFSRVELSGKHTIVETLASEGPAFPIYRRLPPSLQRQLTGEGSTDSSPSDDVLDALTTSFNGMLDDPSLYLELREHYALEAVDPAAIALRPQSRMGAAAQLGRWLVTQLQERGVFELNRELSRREQQQVRRLNRALLMGIFSLENTYWEIGTYPIVERDRIAAIMLSAGYRLVEELPQHTYNNYLIFEPDPLCLPERIHPTCE